MSLIDASSEAKKLHPLPHLKEARLAWALMVDGEKLEAILDSALQMEATTDIVGTTSTMEVVTKADIEMGYHPHRPKKNGDQRGEETTGRQGSRLDHHPLTTTTEETTDQTAIDLARMSSIDPPEAGEVDQTWTRISLATGPTAGEETIDEGEMTVMTVDIMSIGAIGTVTEV